MRVKTEGRFTSFSPMLWYHKTLSIAGRPDINSLLTQNQIQGIMVPDLVVNLRQWAETNFPRETLEEYAEWCTFVPVENAVNL